MDTYFKVRNWETFQHYKDRNPPWIKLHNHLLDNYEFECLPDASKAHLLCIWMLASRTQNKMPLDPKWIKRKIGASSDVDLDILIKYGFIEEECELHNMERCASKALVSEEKRRDREEERQSREEKSLQEKDILSVKPDVIEVINHLNEVTGSKYKATTKSHSENISARLQDYSVDDLKSVINFKHGEWGGDQRMAAYLRPQTLFNAGKFEGYLVAARVPAKQSLHNLANIQYESGEL